MIHLADLHIGAKVESASLYNNSYGKEEIYKRTDRDWNRADDARRRGISSVHSRQVFPVVSGHSDILLSFRPVLHRNVRVQLSRGAGTDCDVYSGN